MANWRLRFFSKVDGKPEMEIEGRMIFENFEIAKRVEDGKLQGQNDLAVGSCNYWGLIGSDEKQWSRPDAGSSTFLSWVSLSKRLEGSSTSAFAGRSVGIIENRSPHWYAGNRGPLASADSQGIIQKSYTLTGEPILRVRVEQDTVRRLADQSRFARLADLESPCQVKSRICN